MYRVAICDDDILFANNLKVMAGEILAELKIPYEITVFNNAVDILRIIEKNPGKFNLLILDIILEKYNGIELAKLLRGKGIYISILFMSVSKEFALDGYDAYPIHYLLKPLQKKQFMEIIKKEYNENFLTRHIIIPENGGNRAIELNSIQYIEVLNRKIIIHANTDIECNGILKNFINLFPRDSFVQCQKSFVVNMAYIEKVTRACFTLKNGITVPVGRIYYQNAMEQFISYLDNKQF